MNILIKNDEIINMALYDEEKAIRPVPCKGHVHIVKKGDTLYKLSKQYDVKLFDIMRLNPYVNVYNLQIGDEICIPTMGGDRTEKIYEVQKGDTLADIMRMFNLPFATIVQYNPGLLQTVVAEGTIVKIPGAMPRDAEE